MSNTRTRADIIVLLEKEVRYAHDIVTPLFKGNVSWMRSYLDRLREQFDIDIDPAWRLGFSMQTELENEKARIKRAERVLTALALGEKNVTFRSIFTAYTYLVEGKDRSNEVMHKIIDLYRELEEEYG